MGHIPSLETSQQCVIHMGTKFHIKQILCSQFRLWHKNVTKIMETGEHLEV